MNRFQWGQVKKLIFHKFSVKEIYNYSNNMSRASYMKTI